MDLSHFSWYLEHKYSLLARGSSPAQLMEQVRADILNAYNLYVNKNTAKDPVLEILAGLNEHFSQQILALMNELIVDLDTKSPQKLYDKVNVILGFINEMKSDPHKIVRHRIHDLIRIRKESDRNYREHVKSKFEMIMSRLSGILEKKARILKGLALAEAPLEGGLVSPQRKELSKEKLLMFMRTPIAQQYGLDDLDVMTKALEDVELRSRITTLINAVDRGSWSIDRPELMSLVQEIAQIIHQRQHTNEPYLESE